MPLDAFKSSNEKKANQLDSALYQKPNNAFLYLHFDSFHTEAAVLLGR